MSLDRDEKGRLKKGCAAWNKGKKARFRLTDDTKYHQKWRAAHPDKMKEYGATLLDKERAMGFLRGKLYQRNKTLRKKNGVQVNGVIKRPHPGMCELCGKAVKLQYHHWDDGDIEKGKCVPGLWVCIKCDGFCETVDYTKNSALIIDYLERQTKVVEEAYERNAKMGAT